MKYNFAQKVIIVAGPTASGKSGLALKLAQDLGGIVINADSLQIYQDLPILTAKPSAEDYQLAPHALYDILPATQIGSVSGWLALAQKAIKTAFDDRKIPIVVGGTGLYLKALTEGLSDLPEIPTDIREDAERLYDLDQGQTIFGILTEETGHKPKLTDRYRLIRAYEVWKTSGVSMEEWHQSKLPPEFKFLTIRLMPQRENLYHKINDRFIHMIDQGAIEEVKAFWQKYAQDPLPPHAPILKTLGLTQLSQYLADEISLDEAIKDAQQVSRQYAKRQITWLRHQMDFDLTYESGDQQNIIEIIAKRI